METTLKFLAEQLLNKYHIKIDTYPEFKQANKMFEQQIMDAFEIGDLVGRAAAARVFEPNDKIVMIYQEITSEEYYNKTFKSE